MNEAMKVSNIEEYSKKLKIELARNFLYVYTEPSLLSTFKYGAFSSLIDLNNFLLFILPEKITLIGLTISGDFSEDDSTIFRKDIEFFKIRKGLFQYKIILKVFGEKQLIFKAGKNILAAKWQKENVAYLNKTNWYK